MAGRDEAAYPNKLANGIPELGTIFWLKLLGAKLTDKRL